MRPLLFIAVQVFQIVVFVVPGEVVQISRRLSLRDLAGDALLACRHRDWIGRSIFFLARWLGVPFVNALFSPQKVEKARKLLSTRGSKLVFFLLFVIPGIPKDVLCYVAGLSPLRFRFFILASMLGRVPGVILSALIGESAAQKKWVLAAIVAGVAVILFAVGFIFRDRIEKLLNRFGTRGKPEKD